MHQEQSGRDPSSGPTYLGFIAEQVSFSAVLLNQCWPGT